MDDHGFDAHFAASAQDTQRNFAAIGDQNLVKHGSTP
jgi:hypothetical protein